MAILRRETARLQDAQGEGSGGNGAKDGPPLKFPYPASI